MLWVLMLHEYKFSTHKLHSRWDRVMLQYSVIGGLIQFALYLVQISKHPHSITKPSPCFTVCAILRVAVLSPRFCCTQTLLFDRKFSNFIPLLYCLIFSFLGSSFLAAIRPYKPALHSLLKYHSLFTVDVGTFFHGAGTVLLWCLEQSVFCHTSWWLCWNCPCTGKMVWI